MTTKELFLDQFNACYDEENWFKPLKETLDGLTPEQASWNDGSSNHSILQLVHHLIFWNERYLYRFKEIPLTEMKKSDIDPTFEINEKDWELTLKKLDEVMSGLQEALKNGRKKNFKAHRSKIRLTRGIR